MAKITIGEGVNTELQKQCDCESSISGPRLIWFEKKTGNAPYYFLTCGYKYAKMACDKCQTPWR